MANVAPISYVEAAQLAKVQNYGGLMLEYLGQTGRGRFNTATQNYQKEWNKALAVVAKTTVGLPVTKCASVAAKAAPLSCRK